MSYGKECQTALEAIKLVTDPRESALLARTAQNYAALRARAGLKYGQPVKFHARGVLHTGTIVSFNPKSVKILTTTGVEWRVSPALLQAA